ncbi:MAG: MGMT family protein [Bacteroidetes bacterium]|nr:MGMT family protein [Bacteroidota bacterium]
MAKKTFNEKLMNPQEPEIIDMSNKKNFVEKYGGNKMLIATPMQYNNVMKSIPEEKVITSDIIRNYLAENHNADYTCHLTAGIFINIVAKASKEREETGEGNLVPYWRTLKQNGELNEKYPDGVDGQKQLLEKEKHIIIQKGKRFFVKDYKEKLAHLG